MPAGRPVRVGVVTGVAALLLTVGPAARQEPRTMNDVAESYVKLVLALGEQDPGYVDAYYGPAEWKTTAQEDAASIEQIGNRASALLAAARQIPTSRADEMTDLRHAYLVRQLEALQTRVTMLEGRALDFDAESSALYDAVAPAHPESKFRAVLESLARAIPGRGSLVDRYQAFKQDFLVPADRLDRVFEAAIGACRERTKAHLTLPQGESFTVEYVTDKSWSGYNWYQGGYRSLIQVNTDLPISVDRAVDLACHEGYPGHHTYNVLLERGLVRERGWVEYSVYPLFSPQSLIAEGTANFGIDVAFPGDERVRFERDVLFPLAGLDGGRAGEYYQVLALVDQLGYAGNEAARRYLNGEIDADATSRWLAEFALSPPDRAAQQVRFFDQYRSYVINYNLGKDLVREYVEAQGGTADDPARRWSVFGELISSPRLPSGLR